MEERKPNRTNVNMPAIADPRPPKAAVEMDFGEDAVQFDDVRPKQRDRWRQIPVAGSEGPGKKLWNVLVRHSPFLNFKQCNCWGIDEKEAHKVFLEAAHKHHEELANRERGPSQRSAAKAIREKFALAVKMSRSGEVKWTIRLWDEVKAERAAYREILFQQMSREQQLKDMMAGKQAVPALTAG